MKLLKKDKLIEIDNFKEAVLRLITYKNDYSDKIDAQIKFIKSHNYLKSKDTMKILEKYNYKQLLKQYESYTKHTKLLEQSQLNSVLLMTQKDYNTQHTLMVGMIAYNFDMSLTEFFNVEFNYTTVKSVLTDIIDELFKIYVNTLIKPNEMFEIGNELYCFDRLHTLEIIKIDIDNMKVHTKHHNIKPRKYKMEYRDGAGIIESNIYKFHHEVWESSQEIDILNIKNDALRQYIIKLHPEKFI